MLINFFKNFRQFFCSVLFWFFSEELKTRIFIVRFSDLFTAWSEFYKKKFEQCSTEISVSNSWISQNIEIIDEFAANNIGSNVSIDLQIGQMMEEVKLSPYENYELVIALSYLKRSLVGFIYTKDAQ